MATEEEAREAADGEEALDLGPVHMQPHIDSKLSSTMEIKSAGEIIDSAGGMLKIPEDQVLVEAPSEVKLPPEHKLNGTASSMCGHMDQEEKISNEKLPENKQKDHEVEAALDGTNTDQSNRINKDEVTDCLSHGESTTEDNNLLKHEKEEEPKGDDQQDLEGVTIDNGTVQDNTLKTDNAIGQTVDGQQDQNLESASATEDTQPASMADIPNVEVVAEASAGIQTPVEPNLDGSDAIPDTIDGNTKTDEPAKANGVVHLDHKESFPEDTSIAEPTEEVVKVEDQQTNKADATDADVVQEEMPKCDETDVQEEMPKSEHADESTNDNQKVLNQESAEETSGLVNENTEETAHTPEEKTSEHDTTTREPAVNIQVQNQESLEETEDAEAVGTEEEMQQSSVAFEEAIPEDHEATTEPSSDIQYVHNVESDETKGPEDAEDDVAKKSNVDFADHEVQDKILLSETTEDIQPVLELEQTDKASDQTHAVVFSDPAQEDGVAASEPQVIEMAEEATEATETQDISQQGHVDSSKELSTEDDSTASEAHNDDIQETREQDSVEIKDTENAETHHEETISTSEKDTVEDDVTAEGPICASQEVDNVESTKEITENIDENEVSNVATVDEADEEANMLRTEDNDEKLMRGLEPEETKNIEPVETEETSNQRHAALFNDSSQEDNTPASEKQKMESAIEVKEIEASKTEAIPQETNACVSEEPSPENNITESEATYGTQEVNITESSEAIEGDKYTKTEGISDQSNMHVAGGSTQENVEESEPTADTESVQKPESEEMKDAELVEVNETSQEMNAAVFQKPTQDDNPTTRELHVMESAAQVSNIEATEKQATPHQSNADQLEEQATEENKTASQPQILEPESVLEMNVTEASEPQSISQQSIMSTSEESVPEEKATEDNVTIEPNVDHQQIQDQESAESKETEAPLEANKPQEIASSCIVSTSEESTSEDNATATELSSDTQAENLQSSEVNKGTENAKIAEEAAPEEQVETEATADISPMQEPELEETKDTEPVGTEDSMTSRDLPAQEMDMVTMETEAIPHESPVASIKELTEDDISTANASHADIQPVLELESVKGMKCIDTTEHQGELQKIIGSASDELTPTEEKLTMTEPAFDTQQVQNLTSQEIKDSGDAKTDQISDLSSIPTPEEADQESNVPRSEPTSDVQQVQELGSKEETRGIEAVETEDHQQHKVSTLEEPAVDSEPNVDDQQVNEDKSAQVKDSEAMEAEEVFKQSNITTPDNVAEERSELGSDPELYVQSAAQVELSRDSEDSQLVKAEETLGQSNIAALEETTTEDSVASEADPPVDIKQEHELESVEEIKGIDATEAEEDCHTSQADATQAMFESDPQAAQDVTEKNDTIKGGEQTNDHDYRQPGDVALQPQTCETDALEDDEAAQNVDLDQQQKEDAKIESQKEELLVDEQKYEEKTDDFTTEPLVEPQNIENGTTNRTDDTDASKAEQTEAVITETLTNEQAPNISEECTPSITDMKIENVEGTDEEGAEDDNKAERENAKKDNVVAKDSTGEQGEITDEISKEELEFGLASSVQEISDPAPSNDEILEKDHIAIPQNVESRVHREDKECTNKVNDDVHTIQPSDKEENKEMQNEDNVVHHNESQTKSEEEEAPQLCFNQPYNTATKIDDTTTPCEEIIHDNTSIQPREIEEIGENKGLDSISETSIKNNVEQDLSSHQKVEDEKLSTTEQNAVDIEAMQEKVDESASDINQTTQCQEEINADDVLQLETEESATAIDTNSDTQAENLQSSEVTEDTENAKIAGAAPEVQVVTEATADISPVQEPKLEETKDTEPVGTEDSMISRDLSAEKMDMEAMETEAIPHESPVASINELTEDGIFTENAPHADIQPVLELESVEDTKCTDTTEHPGQTQKIIGSTSDDLTPTEEKTKVTEPDFDTRQVQNLTSQKIKDNEDAKNDQISDLSSLATPEEADQESNIPRIEPTSDVQQVQELGSFEARGIEAVGTDDHQRHRVPNLEEPAVDSESNVDDQQVHEDKPAEVKESEAMEDEEVFKQSDLTTPDNAPEERSELGSDPELYVQPALQVELSKDSEDNELVKAEETSGQSNIIALEETTTEDSVASEIDPPIDTKQEHEQESVEGIKGIDATEAEEDVHTRQADAIEELVSERNIATIEPTYDIQQVSDLEATKEMKATKAIYDEEQTETATLEGPYPADNGTKLEEHPVESNEEDTGNETDNVMVVHGIKDEIQTSTELKVEDEKLPTTEQNAVDIDATQENVDKSASDINQTMQCQEEIDADDVLQLETEENAFDMIDNTVLNEKTETSNTAAAEAVTITENFIDKASGAHEALPDESLKTFNDTRRELNVSSVTTASKEESMSENMEDHKLVLPAHPAQDENTPERAFSLEETERDMPLSENLLPTEPKEQDKNQPNEQEEEDMQAKEIVDAQKEVEQDLPISHFLMNLILGKENGNENGNSESEAESKQEKTTEDNSCLIISKQEESLVSLPAENKVDEKLTFEQEKHDVKYSEETQEMVKEQSHDLKLDIERSIETEELNKNTHDLETPAYQDNSQDEISGEMFSEEAASVATKMETRDIEISNIELDDSVVDFCQENREASTTIDDLTNTKASEEGTLREGQTGLLRESLPEDRSADAVSEQTHLLTENGMTDAKDFPSNAECVQNPVSGKQDESTESSNIEVTNPPDLQLENEVDKKEEKQHASTATCEVSEEHVESLHDNLQKSTSSEATSDEQAHPITEPVSNTEMTSAHEKEISEGSTCMDEKENSNFSINGVENFETAVEAQANGPKMQINQDEVAYSENAMEPERLVEPNFQEHQKSGTEQKSPKVSGEGDQQFLVKKESVTKQEDVHETVESHAQIVSIASNEEQKMLESKVQERDLNVISPKEVPDAEDNFVDVTKPEFSTDEEQSPKTNETKMAGEKTYDAKTKDEAETKSSIDEAVKTEAPGAGQKAAHKKHNLLSGVGSKVKHQLAKVKKAIVGKPGHTKPESPKA